MPGRGTETEFELTTIERLEQLGYQHHIGFDLDRPRDEVVLPQVLRDWLAARYPDLPESALDAVVSQLRRPDGVDTVRRNMAFHQNVVRGFELKVDFPDGRTEYRHIYPIDWEDPENNHFWVVNQLPVHGRNDRRPDMVIYINGLPLVVFELKNPYAEEPTVEEAYNQIQHYIYDIPQLFDHTAFVVISDGVTTHHGVWTASDEWYGPWKSIDGFDIEPNTTGSMKTLIQGLFPKDRLLSYIRDFVLFEDVHEKITKKGARYHQYFAVRLAAAKALETFAQVQAAAAKGTDRRIGVIWHTTGAGKSLSMVFLVGILRRHPDLQNPSFVIEVDRNDLDDQLHDQFLAARSLVGGVKQAESTDDLRKLLQTEGGEVICTTVEKFRLKEEEIEHPVLSTRSNIIIIADEAHRSQYGFKAGYARYLADALPNALRLGFTGTPISFSHADTVQVFGDLIHTYDIEQAQEDGATVPIFYHPRQVALHLSRTDLDAALADITEDQRIEGFERHKGRWTALAALARTEARVQVLAQDLLAHFLDRNATLDGKALIVCMMRENCVKSYEALTALPGCPETKIVMTGNLSKDPPEWSANGYLTTKAQRDAIKQRMIDPDDPLKMTIVCDMWLTGTDIPCLHTLYVDKPMHDHNMIQAISRVNRVFRDKPHGLVVDYIGIGDQLREATSTYTKGGGRGDPAPSIEETARPLFFAVLQDVRDLLPDGHHYGAWRALSRIDCEDLYALVYGYLAADDELRDRFLQAEARLSKAFLLVKHLDDCRRYADEIIFYQRVRKQLAKTIPGRRPSKEIDHAVRDLVDDSVASEGVVDIFQVAGIDRPDISILDDNFLQTFKDRPYENLQVKLLQRIVDDEIQTRRPRNLARARSFQERLEQTLRDYHKRLIDAAHVIMVMVEIRQEMEADEQRAQDLGLTEEELAFYDAVAIQFAYVYDEAFLRDLIHDVVQTVKRNLKVDWTESHREDVKATVRAAVRRVLYRRKVRKEDFDDFLTYILVQAEALYADWPLPAYALIPDNAHQEVAQ